MSEQDDNTDQIRRGYEAFVQGDTATIMDLFDDDVEWVQPGNSTISGTYHGKHEVGQYLGALASKGVSVTLHHLVADGDTVVALTEVSVDGETGHNADVFTMRAGKTVRVEIHTDTALMERVYGVREQAAT
ncbi:nuclear transport factor 2 family protein [Mycolicibacterium lacusdiani]|uniref:nuclear transport factor 2 family protein n=1 Tax=Mycolicibacterium lacusdiani TaxID=2895283 RepID=UPI001F45A7C9|nr:nuclear transport factor 2 family protein [Mycolicibacterium lacusdiani]